MVDKKIVLHFPKRLVDRPIISHLIKDHDLEFTILKASVTQNEEGLMVLELKGKQEDYDKGIAYLNEAGVIIESLSQNVTRNEERCTHCGACITVCPAKPVRLVPWNCTFRLFLNGHVPGDNSNIPEHCQERGDGQIQ